MIRMKRSQGFARFVAIGVMAILAVSACGRGGATPNLSSVSPTGTATSVGSSGSGSPSSSTPPAVPGVPADVPRTGHNVRPGEQPPVYPVAALARTQAGANAFAVFFMQTLDWAYATTNPSYMKHYYGPTCGLCDGLATGISKTAVAKHFYEGGRFALKSVLSSPIGSTTAPADYCSILTYQIPAQTVVDSSGNIVNGSGADASVRFRTCEKLESFWSTSYLDRL